MAVVLEPIGVVRTGAPDEEVKREPREVRGEVEVFDPYAPGLEGIDGFSHLFLLTFLDRVGPEQRGTLRVRPRGLLRFGLSEEELPEIGVFASDSPVRPNPIGLSVVELLGRRGPRLEVRGLDVFDGTPVLDLKPYTPDRVVPEPRTPGWHRELLRRAGVDRV